MLFERLYQSPESIARLRANEREERELMVSAGHSVSLSPESMLFGNRDSGIFRLHVAAARTLAPSELLRDFHLGMRELARRFQEDPDFADMTEVVGTSWLVGEHPDVARRMGFHVDEDPLPPDEVAAHFGGETRRVQRSWMTRDELMAKYGR